MRRTLLLAVAWLAALGLVAVAVCLAFDQRDSLAAGCTGGAIAVFTWTYLQHRDTAKTQWEAIRTYYEDGDAQQFRNAREWLTMSPFSARRTDLLAEDPKLTDDVALGRICNLLEKWARLVQRGYLPLWVFDGPSGDMAANMFIACHEGIRRRRNQNPLPNRRHSRSYEWLVRRISRWPTDYLKHWPEDHRQRLSTVLQKVNEPLDPRT